jgi:uncharacterized protein (DUF58 family)
MARRCSGRLVEISEVEPAAGNARDAVTSIVILQLMSTPRQVEPRRRHRLTRLGFHFLFVGIFAMLGGSLRGFNLLLVLAGFLVAVLIVQWRWSRRSIAAVSLDRRLPTEAFVGKPFRVRFRLCNHSRLMPAWMLRVEDSIALAGRDERTVAACGVGVISPQQTVVPHFDCVVTRRGKYRFGPSVLSTTFPFSLISSQQTSGELSELHVYPRLLKLRSRWQRRLLNRSGGVAVTVRRSGPTEGDFFGLREWQTGDNPKWIHWRTTARIGEPAVRQFEQQRRFDTCILVDGYLDDQSPSGDSDAETAISLAATFLIHLVGSPSNRLVLGVAATETDAVVGGGSSEGKRRMLSMLAQMDPSREPKVADATEQASRLVGPPQDLVVISTRSIDQAMAAEESLSIVLQPWMRRGSLRWINVSGPDFDQWAVRDAVSPDPAVQPQLADESSVAHAATYRSEGDSR